MDDVLSIIKRSEDIFIYGAGGMAHDIIKALNYHLGRKNIRIVVSDKKCNPMVFEGYTVCGYEDIIGMQDVLIIIALQADTSKKVYSRLIQDGFFNIITVDDLREYLFRCNDEKHFNRKVVFSNFGGGSYGCNPKYICENLRKADQTVECVWASNSAEGLPEAVKFVKYGTEEYYSELATAMVWVDNTHKSSLTKKRAGQYYIQTWHGTGPLKKIEYDTDNLPSSYYEYLSYDMAMVDLCISGSSFNTEQYKRAFRYSGEILESGSPRNDIFWDKKDCKAKVNETVKDKKWILYAPTLRVGKSNVIDTYAVLKAFESFFGEDCVLLIREHPQMKLEPGRYVFNDKILNTCEYPDIQELLAGADVLITDYSSVMWDFSLQRKPVFLYHPDVSQYEEERGYYIPFREMPYIEAFDIEDLCRKVASFDEKNYRNSLERFFAKYKSFDDGSAATRVCQRILNVLNSKP